MKISAQQTVSCAEPISKRYWKQARLLSNLYHSRMKNLFYTKPEMVQGKNIQLVGPEAHHAGKVLRNTSGDSISITNGTGTVFSCVIREITAGSLSAEIISQRTEERATPFLAVAIGNIKKRDRLEFAVEKVTELGAGEIFIFKGENSVKGGIREDRLSKTIESAMKQSLRAYLPVSGIYPSLEMLITEKLHDGFTIVVADEELKGDKPVPLDEEKYLLVVGPEGGFSEKERAVFDKMNVNRYSLGDKRLRTETAAIVITDQFRNCHMYKGKV